MKQHASGQVELVDVKKQYDGQTAVETVSISIEPGEFFSLLGSSGCGKTTTLRMIGGFVVPDSGSIRIDGRDITRLPPHQRPVNTVFQNYALFPHLTVAENVAFGLRYAKTPKAELDTLVTRALDRVQLGAMRDRNITRLSGGQQQRVALARAIVLNPRVLLLDEPLGALDAQLRRELQIELKSLQTELGMTFVYVTHDQEEALTMSDRMAVMRNGRVERIGDPAAVYNNPGTEFVARFLGNANIVRARVVSGRADVIFAAAGVTIQSPNHHGGPQETSVSIRRERLRLGPSSSGTASSVAVVLGARFNGSVFDLEVRMVSGDVLHISVPAQGTDSVSVGDRIEVHVDPDGAALLAA